MTDLVPPDALSFAHGPPGFAFTAAFRCFPGRANGLLFRLVHDAKRQWAFHNDTRDLVFRVRARLGPQSRVKAFGRTRIDREAESGAFVLTCTVEAGRTERFLEGVVNGFEIDCASEAAPCDEVQFEKGKPTGAYDRVYKCFRNNGNGMLFRLVAEDIVAGEETWSYYNDTTQFVMVVDVTFADKNCVRPLGSTTVLDAPDNPNGAVFHITINPLCTERFIRGNPHDFDQAFVADPIPNEQYEDPNLIQFQRDGPDPNIIAYRSSKVFRAFKDNGNGMLFLFVDEENKKWVCYNDSNDYNITATVTFAPGSVYLPGENSRVRDDPEVSGGTICEVTVPPNTTELFIYNGNPETYSLSFAADSSHKAIAEENPVYENGGPDMSLIASDSARSFRCFKDRGNGLLFRIVDEDKKRWFFYNDTKDVVFNVKVAFDESALPEAVGSTKMDYDNELGEVYILEVPPLATERFIVGDVSGFTTKFTGRRHRK